MIKSFKYTVVKEWSFSETEFNNINLIVGVSGAGKSRFLNALFNLSSTVVTGQMPTIVGAGGFFLGKLHIVIEVGKYKYDWSYNGIIASNNKGIITECITRKSINNNSKLEVLVERTSESFKFLGKTLPKLPRDTPSVNLLKEENILSPLYEVFARVKRRSFDREGLQDTINMQNIPKNIKIKNINDLLPYKSVSAKMYLLKKFRPELYSIATKYFKDIFPTIEKMEVKEMLSPFPNNIAPLFSIKEKGVTKWIGLNELSSGMQKVLLIITDILTLPDGSIYMIDEYENSLGVNAINFLPDFLAEHGGNNQYFITTHHPHLINNMPVEYWYLFNRQGSTVNITSGIDLKKQYGISKQKALTQLINDPQYLATN